MYAYVEFIDDNVKMVIPVKRIRRFHPKHVQDFVKTREYEVYWSGDDNTDGGYYPARILSLSETDETPVKRPRVPPPSDNACEDLTQHESPNKRWCQAKKARLDTRKNLKLDILKDMALGENGDDGDVVPRAAFEEVREKLERKKKQLKLCRKLIVELQQALVAATTKGGGLPLPPQHTVEYQTDCSVTQGAHSAAGASTESRPPSPAPSPSVPTSESNNTASVAPLLHVPSAHSDMPSEYDLENENIPCAQPEEAKSQVDIGGGVFIDKKKYERLLTLSKDSLLIKEGAAAIWTLEVLKKRSVTGALSNRSKSGGMTEALPALTPHKVAALRDFVIHQIKRSGASGTEVDARMKQFRRILSEKLCDLRKK